MLYNKDMEKSAIKQSKNKKGGFKTKTQQLRAKLLSSYYGKPIKDMKLIAITGSTGKTTVAHYVHEILCSAGEQVAVLASDKPFKTSVLHKFLNDAWKAGANYVIVTTPADSIRNNVFYGLPVYIAAMTNFIPSSLSDMTPEEYIESEKTLLGSKPENIVLNHDDVNYDKFRSFTGTKRTLAFGRSASDVKILNSKLYAKGSEATLSVNGEIITAATFLPGETSVSYMACAAAIASILNINQTKIIDGLANYCPKN